MEEPTITLPELLRQDRRYRVEAYAFVFEALRYGQERLGLGQNHPAKRTGKRPRNKPASDDAPAETERHLTGQELCEAIRAFAIEQYGYMAKCVLNNWGVRETGDFGEIVYNLIRTGEMRKTDSDSREDFNNVYDFDEAFKNDFKIEVPSA